MKFDDLESKMRRCEYFHGLTVPLENWTILRLDGRGFSRLTKGHFEKPFDLRFHELMLGTTKALVSEYQAVFAFTESDEISLLLPYSWSDFDREVEKIVSLSAGLASAHFSVAFGDPVQFDSRIWISGRQQSVVDYFSWRQGDAGRCALNGWAYWKLREDGLSAKEATERLRGASTSDKNELLFERGVNFNDLPKWQRRGTGVSFGSILKQGHNPITGETVEVQRRRVVVDEELPRGEQFRHQLALRLEAHLAGNDFQIGLDEN